MIVNEFVLFILNIALTGILIYNLWDGYKSGFIKVVDFIGFILAGLLAWFVAPYIAATLNIVPEGIVPLQNTFAFPIIYRLFNRFFVFTTIFLVLGLALRLLRKTILSLCRIKLVGLANKIFGLAFGLAQTIVIFVIISFLLYTPLFSNGQKAIDQSLLVYTEPITNGIINTTKGQLSQFKDISSLINPVTEITQEKANDIIQYFKDQGIDPEIVQNYINELNINRNK